MAASLDDCQRKEMAGQRNVGGRSGIKGHGSNCNELSSCSFLAASLRHTPLAHKGIRVSLSAALKNSFPIFLGRRKKGGKGGLFSCLQDEGGDGDSDDDGGQEERRERSTLEWPASN